jgi:hypothetical protein
LRPSRKFGVESRYWEIVIGQVLCWVLLVFIAPSGLAAMNPIVTCKNNPAVVGKCTVIRGRAMLRENGWFSLKPADTNRAMTISPGIAIPKSMDAILRHDWKTVISGDFEVCPLTKYQLNKNQNICIEAASHLVTNSPVSGSSKVTPSK